MSILWLQGLIKGLNMQEEQGSQSDTNHHRSAILSCAAMFGLHFGAEERTCESVIFLITWLDIKHVGCVTNPLGTLVPLSGTAFCVVSLSGYFVINVIPKQAIQGQHFSRVFNAVSLFFLQTLSTEPWNQEYQYGFRQFICSWLQFLNYYS